MMQVIHTKNVGRLVALTASLVLASALSMPIAASGAAASRVDGWFVYGANMPWLNWGADFGGGPHGGGVSGNIAALDAKLQAAQNAGMHLVRWWVFEGGSPQIQRDGSGVPTGLNPNVYTDLDAALAEAARYDISYNFVLFGSTNDDTTTHQWWEDSTHRAALVNVLIPLFKHYAANPRVQTWEIVNEPEWQSRNGITSVGGMLATTDALANAVHQNSPALVTVGQAEMQDMPTWVGHPLDYYSPHYYDNMGSGSNDPFVTSAASASPDGKAVVIGEFQASSGLSPDATSRWQALYAGGYAGGWPWSLSPEKTSDNISIDLSAAGAFAAGKSDLGPRLSGTGATPTPTPTSAATSTPTPTRTPTSQPATSTPTPRATSTPTNQPATSTPTAQPIPSTATPAPTVAPATWTDRAALNATSFGVGASVRITDTVTASRATQALVDVEIYDSAWTRVYQRTWDNQSFVAGRPRTFFTTWQVPANAVVGSTYTVMVGTFGPNWSGLYTFNKSAASFSVR